MNKHSQLLRNTYRIYTRTHVHHHHKANRICLIGAPGSGKGTVGKYIHNEFKIHPISTGDILRHHIKTHTEIGKVVKAIMDRGELVGDDIMLQIVEEEVRKYSNQGWILDGVPRTRTQAEHIYELLEKLHLQIQAVYFIDVPDEEIISRISGRLVHNASGRTYHIHYNPPKVHMTDDHTGEPLTQRSDDKHEVVKARLEKFKSMTLPVLDFFEDKKILYRINANTSDEAFKLIAANYTKL